MQFTKITSRKKPNRCVFSQYLEWIPFIYTKNIKTPIKCTSHVNRKIYTKKADD